MLPRNQCGIYLHIPIKDVTNPVAGLFVFHNSTVLAIRIGVKLQKQTKKDRATDACALRHMCSGSRTQDFTRSRLDYQLLFREMSQRSLPKLGYPTRESGGNRAYKGDYVA